jgi:hypothetical protein
MKYSDIIMPCSTRNEKIEEFQVEMIDSFVKNTTDECKLWIIENNSDSDSYSRFKDYVQSKKQNFVYMPFDFNLSKLYNEGAKLCNNEYIMYANSDLIFQPDWYYNLIDWFDTINNLFVVSPFTKAFGWTPPLFSTYRIDVTPKKIFIDTVNIPGWFYCLKRSSNYKWNENIKAHYQDDDFALNLNNMKQNDPSITSGIVYNSRVDHFGGRTHMHANQDYYSNDGLNEIISKWGSSWKDVYKNE